MKKFLQAKKMQKKHKHPFFDEGFCKGKMKKDPSNPFDLEFFHVFSVIDVSSIEDVIQDFPGQLFGFEALPT